MTALARSIFKSILLILNILIFNNILSQIVPQNIDEKSGIRDSVSIRRDTVGVKKDTIIPKEELEDVVKTKAEYKSSSSISNKQTFLNKKAQIIYQDMQIGADYIRIDWETGKIYARGEQDDKGKIIKPAVATQGGKQYEYNEVIYNYKTKQAIAFNARTEESEGVIVAEKTKKYNDSVFFMRKAIYTTDEYFIKKKDSLPDYHMSAPNIKLIKGKNNSQLITGPIQLYIEQVPTPLVMPFAILPFSDKRSAGILIPSFGERQDVGFFLNGLGYYQPIGDHFDLKILSDIYTKGSWNLKPELNYLKKYRYSGNFAADYGYTVRGIKGLDDYSKSKTFRIAWRHSQDSKANPYFTFNASVDIVSGRNFYTNTVNNNYAFNGSVLNTTQTSRINVTKRFLNLPITISASAGYNQNFATGLTDIRLPDMTIAVNQFYLFKPKTGVRTGLLENINVNTGFALSNYVTTNEDEVFKKQMWEDMKTGAKNNIALSTNTTLAKYFTFSLSANVDNVLTTKTLEKSYNPISNKVDDNYKNGIAAYSTFSTSASLQTILYGQKNFGKSSPIVAIRHMVTPSFSFTYSPDFGDRSWGYYKDYSNARGEITPYSIFDNGIYGAPSTGLTQSIGFNISNNLEMKVKSKSDSTGVKKVKIFENLNISGGYNFAAEKYKWSVFSVNAQSSFFDNKLNVNSSLTIEPYEIVFADNSNVGVRTENFGHFSLQGFNLQLSYPMSDAIFGKKEELSKKYKKKGEIRNENYYFDDDNYAHYVPTWTLNVNANYAYTRGLSRLGTKVATVGLDGSIKLTPYWNINGSTNYDVVNKTLAYTRLGFSRDQRSFTITFNWIPFGQYKVYDFFIGIKANILKDAVKYKERSFTQPNSTF
ncbi:putative LPS assembly protein LptD [Epilithonimonas mollis]|uniref:LPS assembly outer membrane protein LptD (Organic solvent tolerance protein OstA) n=1 Tax=Epilithonimonas mollis TaxID=216903 RepID=A0A1M6PAE1_9FLAO|nr:putative LPS assembly protein LptD [Epilithonimonas mollis]SHK04832.1 LPS assembly outer membrane protein LptD (organic solvent tolerance protein OstA) [Epilithonimonas mollis]